MILRSKIDGKLYYVSSSDSYSDDIVLEYVTIDNSDSNLSGIARNGGRTGYSSLSQILQYWEEPKIKMQNNLNELTDNIYQWFDEKRLSDPIMQYAKLNEEVGEMAHELTRGNRTTKEMKDAIGDTYVTLVGMAHHLGLDLSECVDMAYNEIKNRKGRVVDGSFIKEQQ